MTRQTTIAIASAFALLLIGTLSGSAASADSDGDGVADDQDNCVAFANSDQLDTNQDGYGNACDADYDNDGDVDDDDFAAFQAAYEGQGDYDPDIDCNGDGRINTSEFICFSRLEGLPPGPSGLACAGTIPCPCDWGYTGVDCGLCAGGYHYEHDGACHHDVAEYIVRSPSGEYHYNRTSPWPSDVEDESWTADQAFPFATIDSMTTFEVGEDQWKIFTSGAEYIIWSSNPTPSGSYFSCPQDASCAVKDPKPGPLGDAFWGASFPFKTRVDAMMELRPSGLRVFAHGAQYVLSDARDHYYSGLNQQPGAGDIGDDWWGDACPFGRICTIDALEQFIDPGTGNDRVIIVSGSRRGRDKYVLCDLDTAMVCSEEPLALGDAFWQFRWQNLPFSQTGVDAMLRWEDTASQNSTLFLTSNTPVERTEVTGRFVIAPNDGDEGERGPDQRILYLHGADPYQKGYAHGYILAQEILEFHNRVIKPWYESSVPLLSLPDPEDSGARKDYEGYTAAMHIAKHGFNPNNLGSEYESYYLELQGLREGVRDNPLVIPRIGNDDRIFGDGNSHELEWTDLMGTVIWLDLEGKACKAVAVWREDGSDSEIHQAYAAEGGVEWAKYNILIVYDNHGIAPLSWVATSWTGHIGSISYSMNEQGMSFGAVAAQWDLRGCPNGFSGNCLQHRLGEQADGLAWEYQDSDGNPDIRKLVPGSLLARHTVETATSVTGGYEAFRGAKMATTFALHTVAPTPAGPAVPPVGAYEAAYVNIEQVWPSPDHAFYDHDGYANTELRRYDEPSSYMCYPGPCPANMCSPEDCIDGVCEPEECANYICPDDPNPDTCAEGVCADGGTCASVLPILVVSYEDPLRKLLYPHETSAYGGYQSRVQPEIQAEILEQSDNDIGEELEAIMSAGQAQAAWDTIQFVLAEPRVEEGENTSEIVVYFTAGENWGGTTPWALTPGHNSIRHYEWSEIFNSVGAE